MSDDELIDRILNIPEDYNDTFDYLFEWKVYQDHELHIVNGKPKHSYWISEVAGHPGNFMEGHIGGAKDRYGKKCIEYRPCRHLFTLVKGEAFIPKINDQPIKEFKPRTIIETDTIFIPRLTYEDGSTVKLYQKNRELDYFLFPHVHPLRLYSEDELRKFGITKLF